MGCVTSKKDINDIHPHIFQVDNVDELGNTLNSGQLEVNETELVLYQRDKPPVRWPLKSLRRYGYDKEYFSFEAGRRCPTGSGVYGFNCKRAEKLFNFVQTYVQVGGEDRDSGTPLLQVEPYYLEPRTESAHARNNDSRVPRRLSLRNSSRLSSVGSSNGCTSPSTPNYINDDAFMHPLSEEPEGGPKQLAVTHEPSYENVNLPENRLYMNVDISRASIDTSTLPGSDAVSTRSFNAQRTSTDLSRMSTDVSASSPKSPLEDDDSPKHCYANLDLREINRPLDPPLPLLPYTRQVNYAVLDLDKPESHFPPPSPTDAAVAKPGEGYVTIDFNRTTALSQSASSSLTEGVRKTRHDTSAIADLPLPTTSRQSAILSE